MVRCEFCKNKIKKKKDPFVKKYYNFAVDYYGNYKIEYFHAWCWELKKTSTLYNEWQYSDIDPRLKNQMIIELAKQEPVMDRKYPHHCYNFNCRKKLHFSEVLEANLFTIRDNNGWLYHHRKYDLEKYKQIKKLWKSKYVQFLCCSCYICNIPIGE